MMLRALSVLTRRIGWGLVGWLVLTGAGNAAPTRSLSDIDRNFVCPEAMTSDEARSAALKRFFDDYGAVEPQATPGDLIRYRQSLLLKHGCTKTLDSIHAANTSVQTGGDVKRQAWLPIGQGDGVSLFVSTDQLLPVIDPRSPSERAVDAYARIVFSGPQTTNVTHVRYNEVVSHNVYYCDSSRYSLIENDYFLHGREVLKDASPVMGTGPYGGKLFAVEAIPLGSLNASVTRWACSAVRGTAS